jgi:transcriptional regulator with XRE-family HTH domain
MEKADTVYGYFMESLKLEIQKAGFGGQALLGRAIGKSAGFLSPLLKGKKKASFDTQVKIATFYGYSYIQFLMLGLDLARQKSGRTTETSIPLWIGELPTDLYALNSNGKQALKAWLDGYLSRND